MRTAGTELYFLDPDDCSVVQVGCPTSITGLDSTVTGTVESGKSLNFVNNTGYPVYVFAYCDQVNYTVTVYVYGDPLEEGVTYKTRGVIDEVIEPGETIINYDTTTSLTQ